MRGIRIQVSLEYFLSYCCGLDRGKIELGICKTDYSLPNTFTIILKGEDERLPKVKAGASFPKGQIIITQDPKTCKLTGKIVVE